MPGGRAGTPGASNDRTSREQESQEKQGWIQFPTIPMHLKMQKSV